MKEAIPDLLLNLFTTYLIGKSVEQILHKVELSVQKATCLAFSPKLLGDVGRNYIQN